MGEVLRLASLVENLAEPLIEAGFEPLLVYGQGIKSFVRGDLVKAVKQFSCLPKTRVVGINFNVPQIGLNQPASQDNRQKFLVVDDHKLVLSGTIEVLKQQYPNAEITSAETAQEALNIFANNPCLPDLMITDLSMPQMIGKTAEIDVGIQFLKTLMQQYPNLNIVVQSTYPRALVRLKTLISVHEGGFTVADLALSVEEMLTRVDLALQGLTYTKDVKDIYSGLEVKPEWLSVLTLAFEEGLQDKAIAQRMNVAERTVRHYWTKIYDLLGVYPDANKNLRIQTEIRAREEGLIDGVLPAAIPATLLAAQPVAHHRLTPPSAMPQGVYGLECPRCHKVSPLENLQVGCPWCGTSLAAAASVLMIPNGGDQPQ
uniref:Response regulator transcription factor n=1 Tax=Desmonostoc muscorum LEGE 12446 TaxID=1828758 RepID=A0A8J6ZWS2_DESMC